MTIYALLLAAFAFAGGYFIRRLAMSGPPDSAEGTGPAETDGACGADEFPFPDRRTRSASPFSQALIPGNYVAIAEIHRFAALRGQIGYQMSDRLLNLVASHIETTVRKGVLGRSGRKSLEFVFFAENDEEAVTCLERLSYSIEENIVIDGCHIGLVTHFGATRITSEDSSVSDYLLHQAESALVEALAKRDRAYVGVIQPEGTSARPSFIAIRDFHRAIADNELELFYQPKLHCRTDKIHAVEALLRWRHPVQGIVNTQDLIDIAEATGAIRDLTKWVIDKAVADQCKLDSAGLDVSIDINLSGSLVSNVELTDWALARLTQTARPMGIEITETAVIEHPEQAITNLRKLADAGVRIAIDDYGVGLSSLAYLKQLPAHELKIDRNFVSGLTESHRDPLIIRSTIDLAHALEMEVTAEGVNDALAFGLLRAMGCDIIQGYLIAQPIPFDGLLTFLENWQGSDQHKPQNFLDQIQMRGQN